MILGAKDILPPLIPDVNDLNNMADEYERAESAAMTAASELPASTLD